MQAIVALGSNLGDRRANLESARETLRAFPALKSSSLYETEPIGCEAGAAKFLNAVFAFEFAGRAPDLLAQLRQLEKNAGRAERHARNTSRTLDLDLLCFGDEKIKTEELELPHPRMTQRRFVLEPLAEILPDLVLPNESKSVRVLLAELVDASEVVRSETQW